MQIKENISLKEYNTFGINVTAKYFTRFRSVEDLTEIAENPHLSGYRKLVLGGGSNMLFTGNYNGVILKNELKGIELTGEDPDFYYIRASAGEVWHDMVQYCISHNYGGVENLSLIPGSVGAAPIQNIGAYGIELKDVVTDLEAYHLQDKSIRRFSASECEFGYRDSIFKKKFKDQFVILKVGFRLYKKPRFHISYGALEKELQQMGIQELSVQAISKAVINIRKSKLPDPATIGNAGSFFKNPEISQQYFLTLKAAFPGIIGYTAGENRMKLAAGWLIEQCGWKGFREGDAGVHGQQALVLVNYGKATGSALLDLSARIQSSVELKFGVTLEREVNIV